MKKIILALAILLSMNMGCIFAQTIKIENGMSVSAMKPEGFHVYNKNLYSYAGLIGLDYLKHTYFYLSSEIGYVAKGGTLGDVILTDYFWSI
jgi:hypothetical protein